VAWADWVSAGGIVTAFGFSAYQTRRLVLDARQRDADRRTERALELYRDLVVEGDTANSFNNVSVCLRKEGSRRFHVYTWFLPTDAELGDGGIFDPGAADKSTLFEDLYRVLWYFERVESALYFELLDEHVLFRTIGFHCWWWGELLRGVEAPKASDSLRKLAPMAADWAHRNNDYDRWVSRCLTDFNGAGPRGTEPKPAAG
jgi:hypothetical protein